MRDRHGQAASLSLAASIAKAVVSVSGAMLSAYSSDLQSIKHSLKDTPSHNLHLLPAAVVQAAAALLPRGLSPTVAMSAGDLSKDRLYLLAVTDAPLTHSWLADHRGNGGRPSSFVVHDSAAGTKFATYQKRARHVGGQLLVCASGAYERRITSWANVAWFDATWTSPSWRLN